MIRLDDPDAAEQALALWNERDHWADRNRMQRVLDAIEVPRLPTRSEAREILQREYHWSDITAERFCQWMVDDAGWAVEDPEPEVDPDQVDALAKELKRNASEVEPKSGDGDQSYWYRRAADLLKSGRISVKVDG